MWCGQFRSLVAPEHWAVISEELCSLETRLWHHVTCELKCSIHIYSAAWKFVNPLDFSVFLHKYDLKHDQIFTQVLKLDKVNPFKQMRPKKSFFSSFLFIYWGKLSNLTYLWEAKVWEPLLSVTGVTPFAAITSTKCFQ